MDVPCGYDQNPQILTEGLISFYLIHPFPRKTDVRAFASLGHFILLSFPITSEYSNQRFETGPLTLGLASGLYTQAVLERDPGSLQEQQ